MHGDGSSESLRVRGGSERWQASLIAICVMCQACSLLLDTARMQCNLDADCAAHGLVSSVCVEHVCQRMDAAAAAAVSMSMPIVSESVPAIQVGGEPERGAAAGVPSAGAAGQSVTRPAPRADAAGAGVGGAAGAGAGAGARAPVASAGAGGSAPCPGAGCPECATDADCELRGISKGTCSGSICFAPKAQCATDKDCEALGAEYVGGRCASSACLPNPRWRCEVPASQSAIETRTFTVPLLDALSLAPVPNVALTACQKRDVTCARPVATGKTGSDGKLKIELPVNFSGYVQQSERSDYMPALYFFPSVIPDDGVLNDFPLLSSGAVFNGLASALGTRADSTRGHMILVAEDCSGMYLPGIVFSSPQQDAQTVQFYVQDQLPSLTLKETLAPGQGGYLNFPPGTIAVDVKQVKTGLILATVTLVVRAGFVTVAFMRPQPRVGVAR